MRGLLWKWWSTLSIAMTSKRHGVIDVYTLTYLPSTTNFRHYPNFIRPLPLFEWRFGNRLRWSKWPMKPGENWGYFDCQYHKSDEKPGVVDTNCPNTIMKYNLPVVKSMFASHYPLVLHIVVFNAIIKARGWALVQARLGAWFTNGDTLLLIYYAM